MEGELIFFYNHEFATINAAQLVSADLRFQPAAELVGKNFFQPTFNKRRWDFFIIERYSVGEKQLQPGGVLLFEFGQDSGVVNGPGFEIFAGCVNIAILLEGFGAADIMVKAKTVGDLPAVAANAG